MSVEINRRGFIGLMAAATGASVCGCRYGVKPDIEDKLDSTGAEESSSEDEEEE